MVVIACSVEAIPSKHYGLEISGNIYLISQTVGDVESEGLSSFVIIEVLGATQFKKHYFAVVLLCLVAITESIDCAKVLINNRKRKLKFNLSKFLQIYGNALSFYRFIELCLLRHLIFKTSLEKLNNFLKNAYFDPKSNA